MRLDPHPRDPDLLLLSDTFRASDRLEVSAVGAMVLSLLDGTNSVDRVLSLVAARFPADGAFRGLTRGLLRKLLDNLDEALCLDSPRWKAFLDSPTRQPSCIGAYPEDPEALRECVQSLFTAEGGAGLPEEAGCRIASEGRVRAVLVPHMDYGRGGVTYGFGFRELFERTDADLFVIVGTSHYSPARLTLSRQNFLTPLGTMPTDGAFIDRVVSHYGPGLFDDPYAHIPEHSIELEVVILQYLYEHMGRNTRIVPLLVGSFRGSTRAGTSPAADTDIARMVEALKRAEAETPERVCYVISGDLAHIGPRFDDPDLDDARLSHSQSQDEKLTASLEAGDIAGYFGTIAAEGDARRVCGLPPTWLTLTATGPTRGRLLHYGRFVDPGRDQSVSFASMAFAEG